MTETQTTWSDWIRWTFFLLPTHQLWGQRVHLLLDLFHPPTCDIRCYSPHHNSYAAFMTTWKSEKTSSDLCKHELNDVELEKTGCCHGRSILLPALASLSLNTHFICSGVWCNQPVYAQMRQSQRSNHHCSVGPTHHKAPRSPWPPRLRLHPPPGKLLSSLPAVLSSVFPHGGKHGRCAALAQSSSGCTMVRGLTAAGSGLWMVKTSK